MINKYNYKINKTLNNNLIKKCHKFINNISIRKKKYENHINLINIFKQNCNNIIYLKTLNNIINKLKFKIDYLNNIQKTYSFNNLLYNKNITQ